MQQAANCLGRKLVVVKCPDGKLAGGEIAVAFPLPALTESKL